MRRLAYVYEVLRCIYLKTPAREPQDVDGHSFAVKYRTEIGADCLYWEIE